MDTLALNLLVGAAILIGLVGVVIPAVPGLLLVFLAVLAWALATDGDGRWVVLGLVSVVALAGQVVKYLVPGRRMQAAGVPMRTLLLGAALGVVGFFVVPVLGALIGFVLGVYLAERARLGSHDLAWPSTKEALRGALLSMAIEFAAAALCAGVWLAGAVVTA
ncbi:DUF456 domain-containing protein [Sporichthya sp.]|uniref:DUF456 domain-containing protein n=1 Tax=Sporichthya sp. TaxID=65475 RepID=UPI001832116A|nr:DUF456 domain-containing protein [Sporichthya sp.]MBA3743495.1 DUF456 domain-containing protein [Sporichthya sp.]